MRRFREKKEDLSEMLKELKVGDTPILDTVSGYEITKVPNGFVYKSEYAGMVFVPDFTEKVGTIKNSVAKTEPKGKVEK